MTSISKLHFGSLIRLFPSFFLARGKGEKKYHLVKWAKITKPKEKGSLGIKDLRKLNITLLCKWWWNEENGSGI
jgi:hypothetical protein